MRALAGILILLPLLVGASATNPPSEGTGDQTCPFSYDPALVEGELLGWLVAEVGQTIDHTRTWSDPDDDEATVEIVKGPRNALLVNRPKTHSYTIIWTPRQPEIIPIVLRITDNPPSGQPQSTVGTLLVQILPPHRSSRSPCGGRPQ